MTKKIVDILGHTLSPALDGYVADFHMFMITVQPAEGDWTVFVSFEESVLFTGVYPTLEMAVDRLENHLRRLWAALPAFPALKASIQ